MAFNSAIFSVFFLIVFFLHFYVGKTKTQRLLLLTICNLVFYGSWDARFIPCLLLLGLLNHAMATRMNLISRKLEHPGRRALLVLSVVVNLGVLLVFKYADFLAAPFSGGFGLLAPLGISFLTFQNLSYTIDVYRGTYTPLESALEYTAAFTFFPHLLAGPIIRPSFLIPQFRQLKPLRPDVRWRCVYLIFAGIFKKTLADLLAPIVEWAFTSSSPQGPIETWASVLGFAAQVYGDISGYTDMATGLALLLGFQLPINFNLPYLASSPADFWRRWHISLSLWIRDYLYYPLALGALKRLPYLNIFVVMVLAGLWHGAAWTCVLFGAYHGLLLALTQWMSDRRLTWPIPRWIKILGTFILVLIGHVIFRAKTVASAWIVLQGMFGMGESHGRLIGAGFRLVVVVLALVAGHALDAWVQERSAEKTEPSFWARWLMPTGVAMFAMIVGINATFIYFQF